jgi:cyclin-dependent kinase-like
VFIILLRNGRLCLVFEFMDMNLLEVIKRIFTRGAPPSIIRYIMWQLLAALAHCHKHRVVHRDVKPENILVDPNGMQVKLCDFGFSKVASPESGRMTSYIATRWYRAPELIVGTSDYGVAIDMFAAGCVMAETIDGDPLLPGVSDWDMLRLIDQVVSPLPAWLIDIAYANNRQHGCTLQGVRAQDLIYRFDMLMCRDGLRFMRGLLELDPTRRTKAERALSDVYFLSMPKSALRRSHSQDTLPSSRESVRKCTN